MNKIKEFISENKILVIFLIVIFAIVITYAVIDIINDNKPYERNSQGPVSYDIKNYKDNEYKIMIVDEEDMVNLYYKDYLDKLINNPKKAWEITFQEGENASVNFEKNYDNFVSRVNKTITKFTNTNTVEKYRYEKDYNYNIITVIDSESYMYEIYEYGVWKYKVAYKGQVST